MVKQIHPKIKEEERNEMRNREYGKENKENREIKCCF